MDDIHARLPPTLDTGYGRAARRARYKTEIL
jgi:hypothetical protein